MNVNFPQAEKKILKYWKKNKIFEKSILQRKNAPNFIFYEGPPTANGRPGIHHVLTRVFKDVICRYKTMQGFKVLRKAGWDTHGLPVELEIEKKLGLKSKKDIEKYGIAKFNKLCKKSVWDYLQDWQSLTERIAFWLDMKNPYITYENDYIETVWWIIKQIQQKGLLYKDYKIIPYCPRCGTGLSSHEVAQGYKRIKENSIYVKFPFAEHSKSYFLVWTTTPWTLPANVALAVGKNIIYVEVLIKATGEKFILAEKRLCALGQKYEIVRRIKGEKLKRYAYEKLYNSSSLAPAGEESSEVLRGREDGSFVSDKEQEEKDNFKVYLADFVSTEEGTGIVHIAPAFGEDDMALGKKENLTVPITVDSNGFVKKGYEIPGEGMFVKDADHFIVEDLKKRNLLLKEEVYEHDYPFCWRCRSPLIYYARQSWFINMQKAKKALIANNNRINWLPRHLKRGRFGEWLKEIKDWAFSRERYWGTPLPVWQCGQCGRYETIGSKQDLLDQRFSSNNYFILRHGHSLRNAKNIVVCWPEKIHCPLTEKGEKEAEKAAQEIKKADLIFSSDLLRTKQTAEIVSKKTGAKIIFDKRLREIDMGELNGKTVKQAAKFWDEKNNLSKIDYCLKRFEVKAPKGENYFDVKKRVYDFLKDVDKKHKGKNIVVVSHEIPLTLLESAVKGLAKEEIINFREKLQIKTGECRKLNFKILPFDEKGELDFHKPYIDKVKFYCPACETGLMKRVPEVIDCWLDSGSMPFAQSHYPFEKKLQFPADFICEAIDQTRGWFYTLLAISTLLEKSAPYKNVLSLGHILDEKGDKMSKSKGNVVDPWYVVEKYGADAARWYFYTVNQPGDSKLFSEKDIDLVLKKFILIFWNCFMFFETYKRDKSKKNKTAKQRFEPKNLLDKWILSRLNELIQEVTAKIGNYDITGSARAIEDFIVNDLSLWYIRRSRKRFEEAAGFLAFVLQTVSKLAAPFIPFLSEEIYQSLKTKAKSSVHLENWPAADKKSINKKLNQEMEKVRQVVASALAERAKAGIKVRQPLRKLEIPGRIDKELIGLIKDEVNVREIVFGKAFKLDTKITPELKEEGIIREIVRQIQQMRKKAGLKPQDKILIQYFGSESLNKILTKNRGFILEETKAIDFLLGKKPKKVFNIEEKIKIEQQELWLAIQRKNKGRI